MSLGPPHCADNMCRVDVDLWNEMGPRSGIPHVKGILGNVCKNHRTDRAVVWVVSQVGSRNPVLDGVQILHGRGKYEVWCQLVNFSAFWWSYVFEWWEKT